MPGSTSTSGIGKFSASTTTASSVAGIELAARVRPQRAQRDLGERAARQPRQISSAVHGSIVSGT